MTDMKKYLILLLVIMSVYLFAGSPVPEWVSSTPNNSFYYWGIGVCELANPDYKNVANRDALDAIVQQISLKVESNSYLSLIESDLNANEEFQKKTQATTQAYLEDLQIFGTYQDKKNYYVCYRLNKAEYSAKLKEKSQKIAKSGYEYLQQARAAEKEGNLPTAIQFYQQGLESVEPWLFLDLSYQSENVPIALQAGYTSVFDGLTLSLQPQSVSAQNYKAINVEIVATLHKNDVLVKNFPLIAQFENGAGKITPSTKTNEKGEGRFYLTQLSGKEATQHIKISIDKSILRDLPAIYQNRKTIQKLPEAMFLVNMEQQDVTFYINALNNNIPPLTRQIASVLVNEHFEVTTNSFDATHIINLGTNLVKVGSVPGDIENLDEWLALFVIDIEDKNGSVLLHYSEESVRVLVPENSSLTVATQQASKELIKRFKREFPKKLSGISMK